MDKDNDDCDDTDELGDEDNNNDLPLPSYNTSDNLVGEDDMKDPSKLHLTLVCTPVDLTRVVSRLYVCVSVCVWFYRFV
jgi:hypothetical protein